MSWRKTIKPASSSSSGSWRDTVKKVEELPSTFESGLRGAAQGASLGFADEITGGIEALFSDKDYATARDESRRAYDEAQAANPMSYGAGQIGGSVATAFVPGLGLAKGASLAARVGNSAAMGAAAGLGESTATDATGMIKDTAMGGALGLGAQGMGEVAGVGIRKAGSLADDALMAMANKSPTLKRLMAKGANFAAGVDTDASLRQADRPMQTAAAEADGFAYGVGQQAVGEVEELGSTLGKNVAKAEGDLVSKFGDLEFERAQELPARIDEFLAKNAPSKKGFSALSQEQHDELVAMSNVLKNGNATTEDLVKFRKYLDYQEQLAGKYDKDGTGPYVSFLKSLRGQADGLLDNFDPNFDNANKGFAQFKNDTGLLRSATNEGRAESMISNLYGANKGAQQEAAERLFSPQTMDAAKDIASNKAFDNATKPGGDNYFKRGALAAVTFGSSELVTNPQNWKRGLRWTGKLEASIKSNPERFGKYAQVLADAQARGPQALASTHFILSQRDPSYRKAVEDMEKEK